MENRKLVKLEIQILMFKVADVRTFPLKRYCAT